MRKKTKSQSSNSLGLQPFSQAQSDYIHSVEDNVVTIALGYAGTGKTYIASTCASQFKIDNKLKGKIILTRPNISDSRTGGYLPGDKDEKMAPWVAPYVEVMNKHLQGKVEEYMEKGTIEIVPFEFMQGRTFDDCYVLLDEAQYTTPWEMKMFLKRIGKNCKVIINGDIRQSKMGPNSGLAMLIDLCNTKVELQEYIGIVEFNNPDDIVRSDFCRAITVILDDL